jgi:hypothetical protein
MWSSASLFDEELRYPLNDEFCPGEGEIPGMQTLGTFWIYSIAFLEKSPSFADYPH